MFYTPRFAKFVLPKVGWSLVLREPDSSPPTLNRPVFILLLNLKIF